MNTHQANAIPLPEILALMGHQPDYVRGAEAWYHSPLRDERTASFKVNVPRNLWYDFGEGTGGTVIDFAVEWLRRTGEACTVSDALRWVDFITTGGKAVSRMDVRAKEKIPAAPGLSLERAVTIQHPALVKYLAARGIALSLARRYVKEVHVRNAQTGKVFYALGFKNMDGGYELRNPGFKGCLAPHNIRIIRGAKHMPEGVYIFEGFMDYLSALAAREKERFIGDAIILNSGALIRHCFPYVANYSYRKVLTWFDNDDLGRSITGAMQDFARTATGGDGKFSIVPMNGKYAPHKDVNAWLMDKFGLPPLPRHKPNR